MHKGLAQRLDRWVIGAASKTVHWGICEPGMLEAAEALYRTDHFFPTTAPLPSGFEFSSPTHFSFPSALPSRWPENNLVRGRLFKTGSDWTTRPTVIWLHGWNGEAAYHTLFPYLAHRQKKQGLNLAALQLPFHAQRKPRCEGAMHNYISTDVLGMLQATQQAMSDIISLARWCKAQGCPEVYLAGMSLGGWLTGLVSCHSNSIDASILMIPITDMNCAIQELQFCEPVRHSLKNRPFTLEKFNLFDHKPLVRPERMLIAAAEHDAFADIATSRKLQEKWKIPELWAFKHGHISILLSLPIWEKLVCWLGNQAKNHT